MMHKIIMKVSTENEELQFDPSDNEDVSPETHSKLLNAVTQIYRKQRIDKPKRREPTLQISEFNLSNKTADNDGKLIDVHDLVNVLNARATHHEIKKKVKTMQQKSKPLPKPMEKLYADKLRRKQGYVNLTKQLNRWEAIVLRNRAAPQLRFPLERIEKVKESHDFMKTFKEPTELEKQVAAVLQTSDTAQEEREKEEELFPLSLEEIIERRKMIAHMRARESYRIAKAIRQNKIKSKKYHRILKRERIKKELKDFEILQKTNPEAALEKLEKIERARAEERISLRHRNTGKWARSRAIRAKYDTEARAQLAEQLAKSRDLTRKIQAGIDSTSEEENDDNEAGQEILQTDPTNPWKPEMEKAETEIKSFLEGFKNYQEENKKENLQDHTVRSTENRSPLSDTSKVESDNIQLGHVAVKKSNEELENLECDKAPNEESNVNTQIGMENDNSDNEEEDNQELHADDPGKLDISASNQNSLPACENFETDNVDSIHGSSDGEDGTNFNNSDEDNEIETETYLVTKLTKQTAPIIVEEKQVDTQINMIKNKTSLQKQSKTEHLSKILKSSSSSKAVRNPEKEVLNGTAIPSLSRKKISVSSTEKNHINGDFEINLREKKSSITISNDCDLKEAKTNESENKISFINKKKKLLNLVNQSGTWEVSTIDTESHENTKEMCNAQNLSEKKIGTIDKIFDNAEHKLKNTLSNHINKLKSDLNYVDSKPENLKKSKYHADLSFKPSVKRSDIDTTLIEVANEGISTGENDIKSLMDIYDSNKNSTKGEEISNIDPQKFLPVKPQKLHSGQLNMVEDYDESEDEEVVDKQRKLNLEEAFADDDVVEEFRREKEDDIEKSNPKDIDLNLPGWGHWAGYNMDPKAEKRRKRKNRRLIIKFPKIPRRDDKKDYVIINEEASNDFKKHMVHDLPFPFKSVKDYEASIRAPIGSTWVPQSAFMKLIQPSVVTKLGNIIEPMSESELLNFKKRKVQKK